jgi:hypothetical protein
MSLPADDPNGQNGDMTAEDFDRFLRRRLCWIDGTPTHASSARQRQCPHCRRKWSYHRLILHWDVALALAAGKSRAECAAELGIDIHTAGRLYTAMEKRLVEHLAAELSGSHAGDSADAQEMMEAWRRLQKLRTNHARNRHLAELCLRHRTVAKRVDLVFQLCFRDQVRGAAGRRLVRTPASKP